MATKVVYSFCSWGFTASCGWCKLKLFVDIPTTSDYLFVTFHAILHSWEYGYKSCKLKLSSLNSEGCFRIYGIYLKLLCWCTNHLWLFPYENQGMAFHMVKSMATKGVCLHSAPCAVRNVSGFRASCTKHKYWKISTDALTTFDCPLVCF